MRFYEPVQELGNSLIYNNLQYLLAGRVAEVLRGDTWENILTDELLFPIGMISTTFVDQDGDDRTRFATPYLNISGILTPTPLSMFRLFSLGFVSL